MECNKCHKDLPEEDFRAVAVVGVVQALNWRAGKKVRRKICKNCHSIESKKHYNYEKKRNQHLERRYNISQEDYDLMFKKQGEKCAICGRGEKQNSLSVDHDHETGEIRGLLCPPCNRAIGILGDDIVGVERALHYLKRGSYRLSWDHYFIRMAQEASTRSKDLSTQVGAIIVKDKRIISTGYNGFPRGVIDDISERQLRPTKYDLVAHAEVNAIINCEFGAWMTREATLYVTPLPPCNECAKVIINSGIKRVVYQCDTLPSRWDSKTKIAFQMFLEAGIQTEKI